MPLTPEEQKELDSLNVELGSPSGGLSPDEQAELDGLNKELGPPSNAINPNAGLSWWASDGADQTLAGVQGAAQGVTAGFGDEIAAAISNPLNYTQERDRLRSDITGLQERNPGTFTTTNVIGAAASPTNLIPGASLGAAGKLATVAKAATAGAAQGSVQGLGEAQGLDREGFIEALKSGAFGGLFGGGAAGTLSLAKPIANKVANTAQSLKRGSAIAALEPNMSASLRLDNKGVRDALGDKIADMSRVGMSGRSLSDKLGSELDEVGGRIGAYREMVDASGNRVDMGPMKQDLIDSYTRSEGVMEPSALEAAELGENYARVPNRSMADTVDRMSELAEKAKFDINAPPPDSALAARDVRSAMAKQRDKAMESTLEPDDFASYKKDMSEFGILKEGDAVLDRALAQKSRGNAFGFRDAMLAKGITGGGEGLVGAVKEAGWAMAIKQLRERSGTTGARLSRLLENAARRVPDAQKYAQPLAEAFARGGEAGVSSLHYVLSQRDPAYRDAMKDSDDE